MFPPKGAPTWRDAMLHGYKMSPEDCGELIDTINNIESMLMDMYHRDGPRE